MAASDDEGDMDVDGLVEVDQLEERYVDRQGQIDPTQLRAEQAAALEMLEARARGRKLALPTDDGRVRQRLRQEGEPITLFGERPYDRRERLREVLVQRQARQKAEGEGSDGDDQVESEAGSDEEEEEEFYTEGSQGLLQARRAMARFSLHRAAQRIQLQQKLSKLPLESILQTRKAIFAPLRVYSNVASQIGDTRPISMVRFSPDGQMLATGSWSGGVRLWDMPQAKERKTFRGHTDKVGGIGWHPEATLSLGPEDLNLVTGAADGQIHLWNLTTDTPIASLTGHQARVARVDFHPSGDYVASASFDGTWRLWDVARTEELLLQEGHSKEVYAVAFQGDGALLASGGLDAIGRVWDLRTGRTAMILDGHAREILSIDFSTNGYTLATASGDDTIRIWDLRQLKQAYTIPAHTSSCSDVRFFKSHQERVRPSKSNGAAAEDPDQRPPSPGAPVQLPRSSTYLASSGYDGFVKIWSADDWQIVRAMQADSKAMSVDISPQGDMLASGEWSRTFKLWSEF